MIGGGAAGARAAYEAKRSRPELEVCLAVAGHFEDGGSTNMVASEALGINAPFDCEGDGDTPEIYLEDMLQTGGGLGDPALCRILAQEAAPRVRELEELGVPFVSETDTRSSRSSPGAPGPFSDLRRQYRTGRSPAV